MAPTCCCLAWYMASCLIARSERWRPLNGMQACPRGCVCNRCWSQLPKHDGAVGSLMYRQAHVADLARSCRRISQPVWGPTAGAAGAASGVPQPAGHAALCPANDVALLNGGRVIESRKACLTFDFCQDGITVGPPLEGSSVHPWRSTPSAPSAMSLGRGSSSRPSLYKSHHPCP